MKRVLVILTFLATLLALLPACTGAGNAPLPTLTAPQPPVSTLPPTATATLTLPASLPITTQTATPTSVINPLTGLPAPRPDLLNRRPLLIKVQNVPRDSRPQWGLSLADIVYEYRIEDGDTRFAALYYGQQPEMVGPIRSARHVDLHLAHMYGAVFIFGGAYDRLLKLLFESDFGKRLVREGPNTAPALFRYEPKGHNYLIANTTLLGPILKKYKIDNTPPRLDGPTFAELLPGGGQPVRQVFVRFSGGMYSRWDYDATAQRYLRFSETQDDVDRVKEVYAPLTDRLTNQPIAASNLVILYATYTQIDKDTGVEVFDINLLGSGKAYAAREGQLYELTWQRQTPAQRLTLVDAAGKPFALKPGNTWYEIMGAATRVKNESNIWHFNFLMP